MKFAGKYLFWILWKAHFLVVFHDKLHLAASLNKILIFIDQHFCRYLTDIYHFFQKMGHLISWLWNVYTVSFFENNSKKYENQRKRQSFQQFGLFNTKHEPRNIAISKMMNFKTLVNVLLPLISVAKRNEIWHMKCYRVPGSASALWPFCFFSMSKVASWFVLGKIIRYSTLFYVWIFEEVFEKPKKNLWLGLFHERDRITDHSLLKVKSDTDLLLEIEEKCWLKY